MCFIDNQNPDILKKTILHLAIIALAWLLQSCSEKKEFIIEGSIKGADAQSVTLTYYSEGGIKRNTITATEGRFQFVGQSIAPTMAVISIAPEGERVATLVVSDGDKITIEADLENLLTTKVKGNDDSKAIAQWITENAETILSKEPEKINNAIKDYVIAHNAELSATAILTSYYQTEGYESAADSLVSLLNAEVRRPAMIQGFNNVMADFIGAQASGPVPFMSLYSKSDSIININPLRHKSTLLCFLDAERKVRDSVVPHLRALDTTYSIAELLQVEISVANDSAQWRTSLGRDTVKWAQTWVLGSVASAPIRKLGIRRVPYFIVADSTGHPIYRGSSISTARKTIEENLTK